MRVLVIGGSMRNPSTTWHALRIAARGATDAGADVQWIDLRELHLPACDGRDESAYGPEVEQYRRSVAEADALIVGSPEYHGSMTGALKNAIDLLGPEQLRGKMAGLVAVARGDAGAMNTLNHLRHVLRWVGAWVLPTQVSVPRAVEAFDAEGSVVRSGLEEELLQLGGEVVRYAHLLAAGTVPTP